ncbi:MAG TPA: NUDIX hydrolase [Rhizomicrobium sp.]|nr:NUDIX hydrolase [Rhizomicrobium sp.]
MTGSQYAALPWRWAEDHLEILLITTLSTRRWVVPKGWPMDGCTPSECAAREALEEAGVVGSTAPHPVGSFSYLKRRKTGETISCSVAVFALEVERQRRSWPEKAARETCWCSVAEALARVSDPGLKRLIAKFAKEQAQLPH